MPTSVRQVLRRLRTALVDHVRKRRLKGLVRQLAAAELTPAAVLPLVAKLREAWGDDGYCADLGFLNELVGQALATEGPYLDCGAGLSTLVLAALARRKGTSVWSLEQDGGWAEAVGGVLRRVGLTEVQLLYCPLKVRDGVAWYAIDEAALPRAFPLVSCDGPAVRRAEWPEDVFQAWRVGVVRRLWQRGISFQTIVLDDAEDRRCPGLLEAWAGLGLETRRVETHHGAHIVAASRDPRREDESLL